MTAADGKVVIDTSLDNKGFIAGIKQMKTNAGGLTSVVKKLGTVMAGAFAVGKLIEFGKAAVELGSNVAEVQNVVDVAFGSMSGKVEEFAQSAIANFGMSTLAAKKTASTYMAMAKGMGLSEQTAYEMSISLAGLTGDVASFYNISQELADTKLKSVFTGETETLKDLGVVMTQANLEAYALSQGITKSMDNMTQAEKVALRYGFVMDSLALAQGDFARTSDSWANQTRILSMQWQELMSIIGQSLITVLAPVVKTLNQIVSQLISLASTANSVIQSLFGGAAGQGLSQTAANAEKMEDGISQSVENQNALTEATQDTAKAQNKLLAGFDEINKFGASSDAGSGSTATVAVSLPTVEESVGAEATEALSPILEFFERLKTALQPTTDALAALWVQLKRIGGFAGNALVDFYHDFLVPVGRWVLGVGLPALVNTLANGLAKIDLEAARTQLSNMWGAVSNLGAVWAIVAVQILGVLNSTILPALTQFYWQTVGVLDVLFSNVKRIFDSIWRDAVSPALSLIVGIWINAWNVVLEMWDKHGAPIFDKIRTAVQLAADTWRNIWETAIRPVWETFMMVLDQVWTEHLEPLWRKFLDFVGVLVQGALDIYNGFILPVVNYFVDMFGPRISGAVNTVVRIIGNFLGGVADIAGEVMTILGGLINFIVGVFTSDWRKAWSGVADIFKGVWNIAVGVVEGAINLLIRGLNTLIRGINKAFDPVRALIGFPPIINELSLVQLPRLAQGAVIPPNHEFLAVLGDQKSGTNIEAPLSTIEQAVENVLNRRGGSGGEQTIILECDRVQFAKLVYKLNQSETKRHGVSLVGG